MKVLSTCGSPLSCQSWPRGLGIQLVLMDLTQGNALPRSCLLGCRFHPLVLG